MKNRSARVTPEYLREALSYDPETGQFTRLIRTSPRIQVGDVAGVAHGTGYLQIGVKGTQHFAHRLAFLYMTGDWPCGEVDHIDGDRANNRWANLRDVDRSRNNQNRKGARSDSRSGVIGVDKHGPSFRARIRVGGKTVRLGVFDTAQEAYSAYVDAKRRLHECGTL